MSTNPIPPEAKLERVASGITFAEGPAADAEGNVFAWYSTIVLAAIGSGFLLVAIATRGAGRSPWRFVVLGAATWEELDVPTTIIDTATGAATEVPGRVTLVVEFTDG